MFSELETALKAFITNPAVLAVWALLMTASVIILIRDLKTKNPYIMPLMKWVWIFTVLYSGPLGLAIYYYSGRAQIARDSLWRRSFRSVSHCYSGCGLGEIIGVTLTAGILALGNLWVALITFLFAYTAGFAMTAGPLIQEGVGTKQALWDAFVSDTASITVMEITAIGVDLWLARETTMSDTLFWSSLVFSLSIGLLAAYPVNILLIWMGIKEGMHNPKHMAEMARQQEGEAHHQHH